MFKDDDYIELKQKFDIYYNDKILPNLQEIEKKRKFYLSIFMVVSILSILWISFVLQNLFNNENSELRRIMSDYGLVACILILLMFWPMFFYKRKNKQSLLPLIANFFGNISYEENKEVPLSTFSQSLIMPQYDEIYSDDNFWGNYKGVSVNVMEYKIMQRRYEIINQQQKERIIKKGQGVVFYARMNKNFKGKTLVAKDKGLLNILKRYNGLERVGIESIDFEKAYEVYSNNQVEARYILTTSMIQHMLALKNNFHQIEYSFFDEHIFINIKTKKNMFECSSFFRSIVNRKRIEKNFNEFYHLFSIIDTLKLNKQI